MRLVVGWVGLAVSGVACDYPAKVAPYDHRLPDVTPVAEVVVVEVVETTVEDVVPVEIPIFDPYGTPVVCSSGTYWTRGDHGSERMHPGVACITCHANGSEIDDDDHDDDDDDDEDKSSPGEDNGPLFHIAGTVYKTAHEPDDCAGEGVVQVIVTDATGREFRMSTNEYGNFYLEDDLPFVMPYTAKVRVGDRERKMSDAQTNGDCNTCHTQDGAEKAPGRIMRP